MLILDNISFAYKQEKAVLTKINFKFQDGNVYLLCGKNGIGKTTLIKIMLGLIKPSSGTVQIPDKYVRSYLPDNNGIYENLTVAQNIKFRLGLYNIRYSNVKQQVEDWLNLFEISDLINEKINSLSLGTKKKVAIICACIIPSNLLIMDEPTTGLDESSRNSFYRLVDQLKDKNKTIICVSHDFSFEGEFQYVRITLNELGLHYDVGGEQLL